MKIPKKRNKIKWRSITKSHIWHIYISKYVYWLNIHSVKVWWRYVLPNTNAVLFCDIFFRFMAMFSSSPNKKTQKSSLIRIILNIVNIQTWNFVAFSSYMKDSILWIVYKIKKKKSTNLGCLRHYKDTY